MRHLSTRRPPAAGTARAHQRGLTLIELMVTLSIAAILVVAAAPAFQDYISNSRLRESGNALYAQALFAQSEAIKRNAVVRLSTDGAATVQVIDRSDPLNEVVVRETVLPTGTTAAATTVDFGGEGRPLNFAAASINLSSAVQTCSTEIRCPGLRVDGGGAIRLCGDHTNNCP
jgi:type IV fimbrial biogenesis protein FimT